MISEGHKRWKVSVKKPKPGNANQKPFERIMIMEYELTNEKSISNEMLKPYS